MIIIIIMMNVQIKIKMLVIYQKCISSSYSSSSSMTIQTIIIQVAIQFGQVEIVMYFKIVLNFYLWIPSREYYDL